MSLFETVKAAVTVQQAAELCGLKLTGNRCLCPFHNERHPSFVLFPNNYHCFGCGAHGDSIDLVAKMMQLSQRDAAFYLAQAFDVTIEEKPSKRKKRAARKPREPFVPNLDTLIYDLTEIRHQSQV
ncbi:MAG: CHC2 zinc finger domain-containing protein [Clostridia bacterium]|nr:CHC2 zinc finger domain-containing protein [Clostridia bacterium]